MSRPLTGGALTRLRVERPPFPVPEGAHLPLDPADAWRALMGKIDGCST
jgi:hypothetical protein